MTMPSLFLSHGAPTLPLTATPARAFLSQLGDLIARPKAILVISAHWETAAPTINAVDSHETIHDFRGFPRALYEMRYSAPGSPSVAARVSGVLQESGRDGRIDRSRGLDHGAWAPLLLMYPHADIAVLLLSVQPHLGPRHHLLMGRALAPLRHEDVDPRQRQPDARSVGISWAGSGRSGPGLGQQLCRLVPLRADH